MSAEPAGEILHEWSFQDFRSVLYAGEIGYSCDPGTGVARIVFNRPDRLNSIPLAGFDYVTRLIKRAERDDDVRVIVLEGAGPCLGTGADARELGHYIGFKETASGERPQPPSQRRRMVPDRDILFGAHGVEQALARCFKTTIVKAHGYCYGGHLQLVLAADIVIAGEGALFTHPAWRYLGPIFNFTTLIETVGLRKAKEMVLTARPVPADEAERVGLVTKTVPDAELDRWVADYATAAALLPADGVAMGKAMIEQVLDARGATVGSGAAWIGHGWLTNLRFGPGEWNFVRERREHGLTKALARRDELAPPFFRMSHKGRARRDERPDGGP
jgi:enoyl-CoA hydratase